MVPLAATGYGSQSKNAVWLAQCETAAAHTGSDGYKVICKHQWNGIGNTTVAEPLSALLLSRLHVKDVIV
ncbi:hypothetical protein O0I10_004997 [Lichtheimia ornata]|uniref:Uncharacterized protein n=1 Tax=Lichtheimia ornata TaxID=688661 RepID=A0AAD7V4M5_9FUNG|nr:uncharacterized protein O0I10_004997 [Lichtheimia ornata]KAJ8659283.1 hypothetical protein O0I10_004997 [Lichtheimia ornata]